MTIVKPFSQACENNKESILAVLKTAFADASEVLELASGTGQHASYFSHHLPHLRWQPSDLKENLAGIRAWVNDSSHENILSPIELDVCWETWPVEIPESIFTANCLHIMSWQSVENLFAYLDANLVKKNCLCIYGPFNYGGEYTSASNAQFDQWLKQRDPLSGIRDFEAVNTLAELAGYGLQDDFTMPANNRLLVWNKQR